MSTLSSSRTDVGAARSGPSSDNRNRFRMVALLLLLAAVLTQAVWMFVIPPFRGIDEFDHVFRAAGVARGDWTPSVEVPGSRGLLTRAPDDLVQAASAQCHALPYPGPANCFGEPGSDSAGTVQVATASARYNPLSYWVVGTLAAPFRGTASLYVMRLSYGLLCLVLLLTALRGLALVASGPWIVVGLLTALTPTIMYSLSVAAPNGIEMMAGLSVWMSLLALLSGAGSRRGETEMLGTLAVSGSILMFLRELGPIWLLCIVGSCFLYAGLTPLLDLWRRRRCAMWAVAAAIVGGGSVSAAWMWAERGLGTAGIDRGGSGSVTAAAAWPLWTFQLVAAIPLRNDSVPPVVYPLVLVPAVVLIVAAGLRARARQRLSVGVAVVASLLIPSILTLATVHTKGAIWQGRYEAPFVVGILPLCGLLLDRSGWGSGRHGRVFLVCATLGLALASGISMVAVLMREQMNVVSAADRSWHHPTIAVVVLVVAAVWGLVALALCESVHAAAPLPVSRTPAQTV